MFPFSPLPLVPQELILKNLNFIDLFKFSLISQKSHLLAKRAKVKVQKIQWTIEAKHTEIDITGNHSYGCFTIRISARDANQYVPRSKEFAGQINNVKYRVLPSGSRFTIISETPEVLPEVISLQLVSVLKVQEFSMNIYNGPFPSYIAKCARNFKTVKASMSSLKEEEASILLHDISADRFEMDCSVLGEVDHQRPLKHQHMNVQNATWFTKKHLKSVECEVLILHSPYFTWKDIQEFSEESNNGWSITKFGIQTVLSRVSHDKFHLIFFNFK